MRNVPVKKLRLAEGECCVATVFDLMAANYGIDRGLGGGNVASSYEENVPYTPKWQEAKELALWSALHQRRVARRRCFIRFAGCYF